MKKICVLFGGKSSEHDVSIVSGTSVISNLDKEKYEIYFSLWTISKQSENNLIFKEFSDQSMPMKKIFLKKLSVIN